MFTLDRRQLTLAILACLVLPTRATQAMCSSQNTGYSLTTSDYMSNGLCRDTCSSGGYALAIVLGKNCWCSNTAPGSTTDVSDCSENCPGYPSEQCGNQSNNLYGYIEISEPSSTAGGSSTTTTSRSAQTQLTTTQVVSTVISVPSQTNNANSNEDGSNSNDSSSKGFFDSPGKVAGTFTAVGVVIVAILGALLWFCCFRNRSDDDDDDEESAHSSQNDEKVAGPGVAPSSSIPMPLGPDNYMDEDDFVEVDQRLDPRQMFMNWENGSRKSLADEMDYSRRVLRVTNADD
ncbi:Cell wall integrity and stress response component 4 [Cyberlindnera fabianii]|uniref:Cell wall integrity and stress response component 4 n=1 Tax=Cyberlindnera fabianii TaxID=36022 RepID=A0A1V2L5J9_CYBFA|nr:Cell wall integrity and stress response component 4 [Cyberlindnera fabianii]